MNISTHLQGSKTRLTALIAAALLCLMTLFGVSSASAHDELVATIPTNGAVLKTSPKEFVLTFSGELKEIGTIINLEGCPGPSDSQDRLQDRPPRSDGHPGRQPCPTGSTRW